MLRLLRFPAAACLAVVLVASPAAAAKKKREPKLELPAELRGTVIAQSDGWAEGLTVRETIESTDLVLKKTTDDADDAVYVLQSGTHRFTALHTIEECRVVADQTFAAAPGGAKLTVKKTLITRGNIAYTWDAELTPQALIRTSLPCRGDAARETVGAQAPWWSIAMPGITGDNVYQPWAQAFTGSVTANAPGGNGVYRVSWILKGSPLSFDPGDGLTQEEKRKVKRLAAVKQAHARQWKKVEIGCGIAGLAGGGPAAGACALLGTTLEFLKDGQADELEKIAEDPPRKDYTTVSKPRPRSVPRFRARAPRYRGAASAVNAYLTNAAKEAALERAILLAMERAQGADAANASLWWHRQVTALHTYAAQLADTLDRQRTLGPRARAALRSAGMRGPRTATALATLSDGAGRSAVASVFEDLGDTALPPAPTG